MRATCYAFSTLSSLHRKRLSLSGWMSARTWMYLVLMCRVRLSSRPSACLQRSTRSGTANKAASQSIRLRRRLRQPSHPSKSPRRECKAASRTTPWETRIVFTEAISSKKEMHDHNMHTRTRSPSQLVSSLIHSTCLMTVALASNQHHP